MDKEQSMKRAASLTKELIYNLEQSGLDDDILQGACGACFLYFLRALGLPPEDVDQYLDHLKMGYRERSLGGFGGKRR
jgi:hypothetical protein